MMAKYGNYFFLLLAGAFGLYYFLDVNSLPNIQERLIVQVLFWSLAVLLVIEASRTTYRIWKEKEIENDNKETSKISTKCNVNNKMSFIVRNIILNKTLQLFFSLTLYILFIPLLGFFTTSLIYLISINYLLGSRKFSELIILPLIVLIFVYFIFVNFLEVRLPDGILF